MKLANIMFHILLIAVFVFVHNVSSDQTHVVPFGTPDWLEKKLSPLSATEISLFAPILAHRTPLSHHVSHFCKRANVICSSNPLKRTHEDEALAMPPIGPLDDRADKLKYDLVESRDFSGGLLPYFRESMVQSGVLMPIPDLRSLAPQLSFLPRRLSREIPFSFAHLDEIKKMFGEVVSDSHLSDYYVPETLRICDKGAVKGESCICATSFEDMVEFVAKRVGSHAKAWSTENVQGSFQNVTIGTVQLVQGNLSEPVAICHTTPFYFQIYYCHVFPKVKLYAVDVHVHADAAGPGGKRKKNKNNIIMACHFDTSQWNPRHLAFKLMGLGPGKVEICHWLVEDDIVFTKV